jgi:SAM-dependent methyltransferase
MAIRDRVLAGVSKQLGRPSGVVGRMVGRALNRGNRSAILTAVDAVHASSGSTVADIGFGGGVGIGLLLDRVGPTGVVHGVEISHTMLAGARRRYAKQITNGTLRLHETAMDVLPLPDECLDAVISTNTIYFVDDLPAAMSELARVMRPGGRLAIGVADPAAMARMPFTEQGFTIRPIDDVVECLRTAGFTLTEDRRGGETSEAFHVLVCVRASA